MTERETVEVVIGLLRDQLKDILRTLQWQTVLLAAIAVSLGIGITGL